MTATQGKDTPGSAPWLPSLHRSLLEASLQMPSMQRMTKFHEDFKLPEAELMSIFPCMALGTTQAESPGCLRKGPLQRPAPALWVPLSLSIISTATDTCTLRQEGPASDSQIKLGLSSTPNCYSVWSLSNQHTNPVIQQCLQILPHLLAPLCRHSPGHTALVSSNQLCSQLGPGNTTSVYAGSVKRTNKLSLMVTPHTELGSLGYLL